MAVAIIFLEYANSAGSGHVVSAGSRIASLASNFGRLISGAVESSPVLQTRPIRAVMEKIRYLSQYHSRKGDRGGKGPQGIYCSAGRWNFVMPTWEGR